MFRRVKRCYDCGLDYPRALACCPRCGETRLVAKGSPFSLNAGPGWKLYAGSQITAAGEAARDLRRDGNDDLWEAQNPGQP